MHAFITALREGDRGKRSVSFLHSSGALRLPLPFENMKALE